MVDPQKPIMLVVLALFQICAEVMAVHEMALERQNDIQMTKWPSTSAMGMTELCMNYLTIVTLVTFYPGCLV